MFGLNNNFLPSVCSGLSVIGLTPVLLIFWVVSVHSMDCPSISDSHGSNKRDNTIWQQAGCSEEDETQTFPGGTLCGPVLMCLLVSVKTTGVVCRCVYSTVVQLYSVYTRRRAAGQCGVSVTICSVGVTVWPDIVNKKVRVRHYGTIQRTAQLPSVVRGQCDQVMSDMLPVSPV